MSLKDPRHKMSKSHLDPKSRILITDTEDDIKAKINSALTDMEDGISYNPEARPGVSNLIEILKHVEESKSSCEELAKDMSSLSMRGLKERVSAAVIACLEGIRPAYLDLMSPSDQTVLKAMYDGRQAASGRAGLTMALVREKTGLLNFAERAKAEEKSKAVEAVKEPVHLDQAILQEEPVKKHVPPSQPMREE